MNYQQNGCYDDIPISAKQLDIRTIMGEFQKLKEKVARMEGEITRLKTIVHKNPKRKDIISTLNTRMNYPHMCIFDKWCKEFPMPSVEEVDGWFSAQPPILETKFVEFIVNVWRDTQNQHPPLYCNAAQKTPSYFVYDVEDVKRGWRVMTLKDWSYLIQTIYNKRVYSVCYTWLWSKDSIISVKLADKYAEQINQLLKHEKNIIAEIKRGISEIPGNL